MHIKYILLSYIYSLAYLFHIFYYVANKILVSFPTSVEVSMLDFTALDSKKADFKSTYLFSIVQ